MHLTLLFLGSQPEELVLGVASTLDEVASQHRVSSLEPGHLGFFGSPRHVRVMWAGVTDSPPGALADLHRAVGQALGRQHIAFEDTPFHAHVTLGRARRGARPDRSAAMAEAIGASPLWGTGSSTRCEEVVLFRSDLRPTGPFYTVLHRARLDAGRAEPDQGTAG